MKPSEVGSLTLESGRLRLRLSPSIGGAISAFEWLGRQWPESNIAQMPHSSRKGSRRPLLSARALRQPHPRGATSPSAGADVRLEPNMAGDPSPLARTGLAQPVDRRTRTMRTSAVLHLPPRAGRMALVVRGAAGIRARRTRLLGSPDLPQHAATSRCPAALASIPISTADRETRIDTHVDCAWTIDENVLPVEKVRAEGRYDLRESARLRPGSRQRLRRLGRRGADDRSRLAVRAPPVVARSASSSSSIRRAQGGIFVAEPVTHANAALNAAGERVAGAGHARARSGAVDEPRHAAGRHSEIAAAFQVEQRRSRLI